MRLPTRCCFGGGLHGSKHERRGGDTLWYDAHDDDDADAMQRRPPPSATQATDARATPTISADRTAPPKRSIDAGMAQNATAQKR